MALYQTGTTIKKTLDRIAKNDLVLPAIQREFVWRPEQICRLFDSLMQGYPFGTFLYWVIEPANSGNFKFFGFVLNYHEKDRAHCPELGPMPNRSVTAVLDGQQRLTSLNIGLRGSAAWKLPRKRWDNSGAFPERTLHLDLLRRPKNEEDEEEGINYHFKFLTREEASKNEEQICWFPVREVLSMANPGPAMTAWLNERLPQDLVTPAHETLFELYEVVHNKQLVVPYQEEDQELDKALQIFIRMNDGGTPLSHSDLLLSIAIAQWKRLDARKEIHNLVDILNHIGAGFSFSKDLVLKAGLMLSNIGSVGFKVDNFNQSNMETLEANWEDIKSSLILTVQLVSSFGFNRDNLTASAILPIAYYLHKKNLSESYITHIKYLQDRETIREWLIRSLLKSGIWGSGLDSLLTNLRNVINQNDLDQFPMRRIREVMAQRGKSLNFEDDEIEHLADMPYGDWRSFSLLSLLFPFVDLRNLFHVDHIFPSARFTNKQLIEAGVSEEKIPEFQDRRDRLANLQLLDGAANVEKSAKLPAEWLSQTYQDEVSRQAYKDRHILGEVPETIVDFLDFYEARQNSLKKEIARLLRG